MNRIEIINKLTIKFKYKSYLEIGVFNGVSFDGVKCKTKIGVDPIKGYSKLTHQMTSDAFFSTNTQKFDIVFIDGLHLAEQVERDFLNSYKHLNQQGAIVLHDCNPEREEWQLRRRVSRNWTGDVWKTWVRILEFVPNLDAFTVDCDFGVGVFIAPQNVSPIDILPPKEGLTWPNFVDCKQKWLRLVHTTKFEEKMQPSLL